MINKILEFFKSIKRLFCKHDFEHNGTYDFFYSKTDVYECSKCGKKDFEYFKERGIGDE
jgi:hypothetical protein